MLEADRGDLLGRLRYRGGQATPLVPPKDRAAQYRSRGEAGVLGEVTLKARSHDRRLREHILNHRGDLRGVRVIAEERPEVLRREDRGGGRNGLRHGVTPSRSCGYG